MWPYLNLTSSSPWRYWYIHTSVRWSVWPQIPHTFFLRSFSFRSFSPALSHHLFFSISGTLVNCKALFLSGKPETSFPAREPSGKESKPLLVFYTLTFQPAPHPYLYFFRIQLTHLAWSMHNLFCPWSLRAYKRIKEWVKASVMKACVKCWMKTDL